MTDRFTRLATGVALEGDLIRFTRLVVGTVHEGESINYTRLLVAIVLDISAQDHGKWEWLRSE